MQWKAFLRNKMWKTKRLCFSVCKLAESNRRKSFIAITIFGLLVIYRGWFEPTDFDQKVAYKRSAVVRSTEHDKWIVLTSIFQQPTEAVKYLNSLEEWKVVIVGDKKTPKEWNFTNCIFLDVDTQETTLGFRLSAKLPYNSYTRKNIGYLYAISQGAKFIYETDDDNRPEKNLDLDTFHFKPKTPGLLYAGNETIFNPYKHFGQPSIWPRGYPLSAIGAPQDTIYRVGSNWPTPAIQQGLVNGDPDVDAIFRLTRKWTNRRLDIKFDPAAPPVFLPSGIFCPFNSQNTLFHHSAFWALYLPTTTTFRMCDIWRSYWAQRLLWEIGGRIGFYPANAYQNRSAHDYMRDAVEEKNMYYDTKSLLEFLENWKCQTSYSFFNCIIKLTKDMAQHGFWEQSEVFLVKTWLEDLVNIGYLEPKRVPFTYRQSLHSSVGFPNVRYKKFVNNSCGEVSGVNFVQFLGVQQTLPIISDSEQKSQSTSLQHFLSFCSVCSHFSFEFLHHKSVKHFEDVLLIVVFNHPIYEYVNIIDAIYRPLFSNIVYCGDDASQFRKTGHILKSFIQVPLFCGHFGYMCATTAMEMNYNVSGYLTVGDDDLINIWNFMALSKDRIWMNSHKRFWNLNDSSSRNTDSQWNNYKPSYIQTLEEIDMYQSIVPQNIVNISTFKSTLFKTSNGKVIKSVSDIFYIPKSLKESFQFYMRFFCKNRVFLEYSVPYVLYGLGDTKVNVEFLHGRTLKELNRTLPVLKVFNASNHFLHPVKLSKLTSRIFVCSGFTKTLLTKLYSTVTMI